MTTVLKKVYFVFLCAACCCCRLFTYCVVAGMIKILLALEGAFKTGGFFKLFSTKAECLVLRLLSFEKYSCTVP